MSVLDTLLRERELEDAQSVAGAGAVMGGLNRGMANYQRKTSPESVLDLMLKATNLQKNFKILEPTAEELVKKAVFSKFVSGESLTDEQKKLIGVYVKPKTSVESLKEQVGLEAMELMKSGGNLSSLGPEKLRLIGAAQNQNLLANVDFASLVPGLLDKKPGAVTAPAAWKSASVDPGSYNSRVSELVESGKTEEEAMDQADKEFGLNG